MSTDRDHVRAHIELAIERAREGVSEGIDEIDRRLRTTLDFKEIAAEHAPQLLAAGAIFGFLLGYGVPRVMTRAIGLGIPILLAIRIAKNRDNAPDLNPT